MGLYKSKASVKVYHSSLSGGFKQFKAPNMAGNLWAVFEFNSSSGLTRIRTVGSESSSGYVDNYGSSLDTTGPTVTSVSTTADNQSAVSITDNITVTFSEAMDNTSYKYKYIDELLSWENANNYCAEQGGHLPALNSAEEHSMLSELCFSNSGNEDCWIGLNDIDLEDDFQWANGTAYPADGYTFNWTWNRADRDCFVLEGYHHNGSIEGDFCNSAKNFLCENPLPPSVTTNTDNTSCYGTLRVSSDNFSSCVQMASSPSISNSDMTFTLDPSDNLTVGTTYLTRVTTGVKDASGNAMSSQYDNSTGFTTVPFQPQTQAELQTAVDLWVSDNSAALSTYGGINTWDVSLITSMRELFNDKTTFNDDISNWNVSGVTSMYRLFRNAQSFNQDISSWDVSNVTNMYAMFFNAESFNQNLSSWDISSVTNMDRMFYNAQNFNNNGQPLTWNVSSVGDMQYMFSRSIAFNQDISSWNVSHGPNMGGMFNTAAAFNQDISSWNVSSVTIMTVMFKNAYSFNQDISSWNVDNVTNMDDMFLNANALSDANKCLIHTDFDNNSNWPYDWSGSCD
jgi:surface protein